MQCYLHKKTNIFFKAIAFSFVLLMTNNSSALVLTPDFEVQNIPNVGGLGSGVAVSFDNVYANPVPVCTYVLADINDDPATVRIDGLSMTGMTVYLQGPAGAALVAGNVHCIIMDEGEYTVAADGFEAEARLADSDETNGNGDFVDLTQLTDVTADITGNYANPVVVGQVITSNDPAFSTFWSSNCDSRVTPTFEGAGDVCVGKHSSFIPNVSPAIATETIGYIVFEEATGVLNGIQFETERGSDTIVGVDPNLNTSYNLDDTFDYNFAVASQSAEDGGNGSWAVLHGADPLAGGIMNVAVDEANLSASTNARAHTTEQVDYIVFAASELTLEKNVINDDGGQLADTVFTLTADGPTIDVGSGNGTTTATSQISRSGAEGDPAITDEIIYPDTYSLSEVAIAGYTAGTWSCTDGTLTGSDLDLDPGDDAVCTITNDDEPAELTIIKIVINDQGGIAEVDDFTVQTDAGGLTFDSGTTVGDTTTYTSNTLTVDADTYRFREQDLLGYTEGSWSCTGNAGAVVGTFSNGSVEVANGEDVTCSITNDDIPASLTIVKTITNDNGGNITDPDAFLLTVDGDSVSSGVATSVSANTDLAINETLLPGYAFESMTGTDCPATLGGTINLEPGTSATCTIVNNDVPASLTIVKEVVNDNGGTASVTDFGVATDAGILIFDGGATSGTTTTYTAITLTVDADTYRLGELDVVGYTEGSWSCTGTTGTVVGTFNAGTVEIALGEDVTCTITNDDMASQITLVKQVNNSANGGSAVADDWTLEANTGGGPAEVSGTSGVSQSINAGDYVLSEINGPSGYLMTDLACDDGTLTGDTLTVNVGDDINCTFTNRDLTTDLQITKTVNDLNPSVGDIVTFTLTVINNGPDDSTNIVVDDSVLAGFGFVAGSMTGGDTQNQTAPSLVWTINSLPAGAANAVTLTYQAIVNTP